MADVLRDINTADAARAFLRILTFWGVRFAP